MKKKAKEELIILLEKQRGDIFRELDQNKSHMKKIVDRQTIQKRKLAELSKIIHMLKPKLKKTCKAG